MSKQEHAQAKHELIVFFDRNKSELKSASTAQAEGPLILYLCPLNLPPTVWRLAQWRVSEHETINKPQKLMRGRMLN